MKKLPQAIPKERDLQRNSQRRRAWLGPSLSQFPSLISSFFLPHHSHSITALGRISRISARTPPARGHLRSLQLLTLLLLLLWLILLHKSATALLLHLLSHATAPSWCFSCPKLDKRQAETITGRQLWPLLNPKTEPNAHRTS